MNITIPSFIIVSIITTSLISSCTISQKQGETLKTPIITYSSGTSTGNLSTEDQKKMDIQSFQDAMNAPNFSACEKEKDQDAKDKCRDNAIYAKAIMSKDTSVCSTIKNEETLGMCVANSIKIGSGEVLESPCTDITSEKAKMTCEQSFTMIQAAIQNDPLLCDTIEDPDKKHSCIMNAVVTEVIKKKNISLCTKIPDIEGRKSCFSIQFGDIKTKGQLSR